MKKLIYIFLFTPIILIGQEYLTYNHNGINRDYIYYEPVDLPDNAPLVIVAHGYSDSHTSIMNYSGMNVIANQNGFAVCYPKGTTDNQWGGQNFWNVGYDFHEGYSVNDIDFLINLAQHLQATYNLSTENTFMTGMSNGAELCYQIACEAPGFFKAFAPVAGTIFPNGLTNNSCTDFSVPFFEIHGSNDDVTLFEGDANDQFWGPYLSIDSISKSRHIWWKLRPHMDFGTIEFRMLDVQRSLKRTRMFIALAQALVYQASTDLENNRLSEEFSSEFLSDSLWKATRFDFSSKIIDVSSNNVITMLGKIKQMVEYATPALKMFGNVLEMNRS